MCLVLLLGYISLTFLVANGQTYEQRFCSPVSFNRFNGNRHTMNKTATVPNYGLVDTDYYIIKPYIYFEHDQVNDLSMTLFHNNKSIELFSNIGSDYYLFLGYLFDTADSPIAFDDSFGYCIFQYINCDFQIEDYSETYNFETIFDNEQLYGDWTLVATDNDITNNDDNGGGKVPKFCMLFEKTTANPTIITTNPTIITTNPSNIPTVNPTLYPSIEPSNNPTNNPTDITVYPSVTPSVFPTKNPSTNPTNTPTVNPSLMPSVFPSKNPSSNPTFNPTMNPTVYPTNHPTQEPTVEPSKYPSNNPSINPTFNPSMNPTQNPSNVPTITESKKNNNSNSSGNTAVIVSVTVSLFVFLFVGLIVGYYFYQKKKEKEYKKEQTVVSMETVTTPTEGNNQNKETTNQV